jgi:hypothetical protein
MEGILFYVQTSGVTISDETNPSYEIPLGAIPENVLVKIEYV